MPSDYTDYYALRQVPPAGSTASSLPGYLIRNLPANRQARILDIGCGHGEALRALREMGYTNIQGVDVSSDAVLHCQALGLNVSRIEAIEDFTANPSQRYDFILMTHVLEHVPKPQIIPNLRHIRTSLLAGTGSYYVAVPNAQSNTGCYWAYEDFTHETLFTAGSLYFVLKHAGFETISFLDPDGLAGGSRWKRPFRRMLLRFYRRRIEFWNRVTASAFHTQSPMIFTFELKAIAFASPLAIRQSGHGI
ncbi:MAG: class I SAM-dependent methyltransferase [Verrucomicrobiota bacterium]